MSASLFGLEAELALCATTSGPPIGTERAVEALARRARKDLVHLRGHGNRLFLANGSLFYVDHGSHPEIATPECTTPWEAVSQLLAGERTIARLAGVIREELGADEVLVLRCNVDYVSRATWGCHESYCGSGPISRYESWLIPHLSSRIIYTGSGGLDPSSPGIRFSVSPRVAFIDEAVSGNSTSNRGIFHTRDEALSSGYSRVHVLAGDNACSQLATWLKVGVTALVVALADIHAPSACPIRLTDPVGAMKHFARNPRGETLVELAGSPPVSMTAMAVQRRLLAMIEPLIGSAALPEWAGAVCDAWRQALRRLEATEYLDDHALDWPLKFALFSREIARLGFTREMVDTWSDILERISPPQPESRDPPRMMDYARVKALRRKGRTARAAIEAADRVLAERGLRWRQLDAFNALRTHLCAFDLRFGELGGGIFESLDRRSMIPDHRVVSERMIAIAADEPPAGSRASLRSRWIKRLVEKRRHDGFSCSWERIAGGKVQLNMRDPFATTGKFERIPPAATGGSEAESFEDLRHTAYSLYLTGRYLRAERILRSLLECGRETAGTRAHLARALIVQGPGRTVETAYETITAWAESATEPGYVRGRILWLQLALVFSTPDAHLGLETPAVILERMREALASREAHMDWSMDPVLAQLRHKVSAEQHALLSDLVGALCAPSGVEALDRHAVWRDTRRGAPD